MHICPYCNHNMNFNLIYVGGSPRVFWSCPHCKYDTRNEKVTRYAANTGEVTNGTSSYMRSMRTAF